MTPSRWNLVLGLAFASVLLLVAMMRVDHSRPNFQVMLGDDMTYSPAYSSFSANTNFANGRTFQDPVPSTIARGEQRFHFQPTPEDAIRAGEQLSNPFDLDSEPGIASADRGAEVFTNFCTACHGADGTGNGPVVKKGFPPPPSLLIGKSPDMKDGQLFHILTYGQNSMPNFAVQLTPGRRWDVINHIRRIQQESQMAAEKTSATVVPAVVDELATAQETNRILQPSSVAPTHADVETKP